MATYDLVVFNPVPRYLIIREFGGENAMLAQCIFGRVAFCTFDAYDALVRQFGHAPIFTRDGVCIMRTSPITMEDFMLALEEHQFNRHPDTREYTRMHPPIQFEAWNLSRLVVMMQGWKLSNVNLTRWDLRNLKNLRNESAEDLDAFLSLLAPTLELSVERGRFSISAWETFCERLNVTKCIIDGVNDSHEKTHIPFLVNTVQVIDEITVNALNRFLFMIEYLHYPRLQLTSKLRTLDLSTVHLIHEHYGRELRPADINPVNMNRAIRSMYMIDIIPPFKMANLCAPAKLAAKIKRQTLYINIGLLCGLTGRFPHLAGDLAREIYRYSFPFMDEELAAEEDELPAEEEELAAEDDEEEEYEEEDEL